ncbi:MAG TPA: thioesterase family protein [Pseudomonadales bacterium]|nr:thioesterase family protein [Pseudomonadales bacterium]
MKKNSPWVAEVELEIPFHDVDLLQVAWHGHYAKYFEIARGKLMDSLQYGYEEMRDSGFAWPLIEFTVRYVSSALLGERVRVKCWIEEYQYKLKIAYLMTGVTDGRVIAKGQSVQVAVDWAKREMQFSSPQILLEKLAAVAPAEA